MKVIPDAHGWKLHGTLAWVQLKESLHKNSPEGSGNPHHIIMSFLHTNVRDKQSRAVEMLPFPLVSFSVYFDFIFCMHGDYRQHE